MSQTTRSRKVREQLSHPVIDGDGHMIEFLPLALEYLRDLGGQKLLDEYLSRLPHGTRNFDGGVGRIGGPNGWYGLSPQERHDMRVSRNGFWGLPMKTLDRATVMLPDLFRERIDDLGIDFAIVYPTIGFEMQREMDNPELRIAGCRAFNKLYADLWSGHEDRCAPAALIPTGTPQEALDELDYAVNTLGLKVVMFSSSVRREIAEVARNAPEYAAFATWMDVLAISSEYDYDPVWKRCVELGVAVTSHSGSRGWGYRASPHNFVYNHIGHFAAANEAFCKAVVLGGVADRFPTLTFAFLEGGVGWACSLYNDLIEHWETRNIKALYEYLDPAKLDRTALAEYFAKYGRGKFAPEKSGGSAIPMQTVSLKEKPEDMDDFKALKVDDPHHFEKIFGNFFFGCEAEDRMTAIAFSPRLNHYGMKLQAMFSSDVGHFDVRDITTVVADAHELVEEGLITDDDFRAFAFENAAKLFGSMNPGFFKGTSVEEAVASTAAPR